MLLRVGTKHPPTFSAVGVGTHAAAHAAVRVLGKLPYIENMEMNQKINDLHHILNDLYNYAAL